MPTENYSIVAGVVAAIIVLLIAGIFILILISYANNRKKKFMLEKEHLQVLFKEQLLQSQVEMQEHTFNIISEEIHDNVGQLLSLAKVQISIMEQGENLNRLLLSDIKESISKALTDLRDIAKSLNTDRLKLNSLAEITNHELQRIGRLGTITTSFYSFGKEIGIEEQKKLIILRIIQEGLQNILKHARATSIEVLFYYDLSQFRFEIKDDGIGFDTNLINKKDGLGLQNIINRASLLGGDGKIESSVNQGTTISVNLPYA
ncbi:sensor histidine kinase [Ferruginibacter sp. SUN106]|uniref:sensor histidine kinase n=1 Tax=Ferruginibacter sp. SUN106 TaxID=2978348 RepID=UPI003D366960